MLGEDWVWKLDWLQQRGRRCCPRVLLYMETLNEIGISENTDKAALTHRGSHHYADLYEVLFRGWQYHNISILELGVLDGGSIRTWRRYFPNASITAVDVTENNFNDPKIEFI